MIRVENLTKRFGELTAVDNISFDVHRGEIFAFLGPNGAGKTTTIKMLTTLLQPTGGSLELDGLDPTKHRDDVRKRFGVVFQDPSLDQDLTAWENMEIHGVLYGVPRKERIERSTTLLKLFELWERRDALNEAIDYPPKPPDLNPTGKRRVGYRRPSGSTTTNRVNGAGPDVYCADRRISAHSAAVCEFFSCFGKVSPSE